MDMKVVGGEYEAERVLNDREYAADIRTRLGKALFDHVLPILREARTRDIDVQFGLGPDYAGNPVVQNITTVKRLA